MRKTQMPITVANCVANGYLEWPMVDHQAMYHYAAGCRTATVTTLVNGNNSGWAGSMVI